MEAKPLNDGQIGGIRALALVGDDIGQFAPELLAALIEARAEVARLEAANARLRERVRGAIDRGRALVDRALRDDPDGYDGMRFAEARCVWLEMRRILTAADTNNEDPSGPDASGNSAEAHGGGCGSSSPPPRQRRVGQPGQPGGGSSPLNTEGGKSGASGDAGLEPHADKRKTGPRLGTPSPSDSEAPLAGNDGAGCPQGTSGGGVSTSDQEGGGAESPNARAVSGEAGSGERARPSPPASPSPSSPPDSGAFAALRLACANEALRTEPRDGKAGLYRRIMAIKIPSDAAPAVLPDSEGGSAATDLPEQRGDTPGASANSAPSSPSDREAFEAWDDANHGGSKHTRRWHGPSASYLEDEAQAKWEAWQASRAALPTRDEIAQIISDKRVLVVRGDYAGIADAILALRGGSDAE